MIYPSAEGPWFVYVILCEGGSLYIGAANDVVKRFEEHAQGKGAKWTKEHRPLYVIHHERYEDSASAFKREKELKTGFGRKWIKRELKAGRLKKLK